MSSIISLPPGMRFTPTGEEVFLYYLLPAIKRQPLPSLNVLIRTEIYGENKEPWNLFGEESTVPFWVISTLRRKNRSVIDRRAGCGCWVNQNSKRVIDSSNGKLLGFKAYFIFTIKEGKDGGGRKSGDWGMNEFSVRDGSSDLVICEIKKKPTPTETQTKKRKAIEEEDSGRGMKKKKVRGNVDAELGDQQEDQNQITQTLTTVDTQEKVAAFEGYGISEDNPQLYYQECGYLLAEPEQDMMIKSSVADEPDQFIEVPSISFEELLNELSEDEVAVDDYCNSVSFEENLQAGIEQLFYQNLQAAA